ncbi:RHS repeat-associated core domain-containing protein [Photobacterium iliopiscarium]|uniref:RHS repeat-associated core domain-containing protein n=1 Tax=Photobacterium iliopiscarium TaxID=56192 RepID=UPI0009E3781E|nr:RHS repeat domain-containing protein [Photobacterium iliopiscarium]PST99844.1 RHS repeat protein [Photobacterium iliopiscarium]PSV85100.1 RHS repeat protein [Photobacterium iliopiscarium]
MSTSLFSNTPSVTVIDNRGLPVRDIAYYRHPDELNTTQTRITHHQYNIRDSLEQSADPRLHQSGKANFLYLADLTGHVLRTQGVDNGTSVSLSDAAGRAFIAVSNISTAADGSEDRSQAVTRTWQYEEVSLPGRPLSITEQISGETARITERFVYANNTEAERAQNLAGQCISHYDTAGLAQTNSIALTGVPLSANRRLLKDADNPDAIADWQGGDASVWNDQLSNENYVTLTTADSTGTVLTTTDTKGNEQRVAYDVSGLMSGSWLTLKEGTEQVIVESVAYSAVGQKLREEQGNGVVTTYSYEPETQRLIGIKTERPTGHALGAKVLQDLRYEYDPVGNVVKIHNDAEETRFWRNQKVVPENTYTYDSLYQLVQATGREMANAGQQNSHLPSAIIPFSSDSSAYTNYTRTYTYDEVGNLTQVKHSSPATNNNYTTTMTVSDSSNRSVQSTLTANPSDVDSFFTVGGQQNQLQPGQYLIWTPRNELLKVTPVVRDGDVDDVDDVESYRYDAGSQRLLKVSKQKAANSVHTLRALYLPGVELRYAAQDNTETESLQVITVGEAGRAQVRVLHWEKGKPEEISNDQIRYSYDSLIGSSNLEVDNSGHVISMEEYYPYGGTAILTARSQVEVKYKTVRYSGKERDATGLYYYGYRYYQPWVGRWLSSDPAGAIDGLNLYRMVRNNPINLADEEGLYSDFKKVKDIGRLGRLKEVVGVQINLSEHEERKGPPSDGGIIGGHALNRHVPPTGKSALDWASRRYDILKDHNIGSAAFFSRAESEKLITEVIKKGKPSSYIAASEKRNELQKAPTKTLKYDIFEPNVHRPNRESYDLQVGSVPKAHTKDIRNTLYQQDTFLKKDDISGKSFKFTYDFGKNVGAGFQSRADRDDWLSSGKKDTSFVRFATAIEVVITTGIGRKGTKTAEHFKLVSAYPITR